MQIIFIIICLVSSILIWRDASKKGMNPWLWSIGGFFLNIIVWPIYLIVRRNKNGQQEQTKTLTRLSLVLLTLGIISIVLSQTDSIEWGSHEDKKFAGSFFLILGLLMGGLGAIGAIFSYTKNKPEEFKQGE